MACAIKFTGHMVGLFLSSAGRYVLVDIRLDLRCKRRIIVENAFLEPAECFHGLVDGAAAFQLVDGEGKFVHVVYLL